MHENVDGNATFVLNLILNLLHITELAIYGHGYGFNLCVKFAC